MRTEFGIHHRLESCASSMCAKNTLVGFWAQLLQALISNNRIPIILALGVGCSRTEVQKLRLPHLEALSHRGNPPPCTLGCTGVGVSVSSCLPSCLVTLKFPRSMTHHRPQRLAVGNQSVLKSEIIGFTMYQFKILKSPIHCYVPKALAGYIYRLLRVPQSSLPNRIASSVSRL